MKTEEEIRAKVWEVIAEFEKTPVDAVKDKGELAGVIVGLSWVLGEADNLPDGFLYDGEEVD